MNTAEIKRKERRSQWAGRYSERLPHSALEDQPLEDGQEGRGSSVDVSLENGNGEPARTNGANGGLWNPNDEHFYGERDRSREQVTADGSSGRWHYPANFEDAVSEQNSRKKSSKKKKDKKDRWARTEDAYSMGESTATPKRKKSKKRRSTVDSDAYSRHSDSTAGQDFPEDPEGGLYGDTRRVPEQEEVIRRTNESDLFTHQF